MTIIAETAETTETLARRIDRAKTQVERDRLVRRWNQLYRANLAKRSAPAHRLAETRGE